MMNDFNMQNSVLRMPYGNLSGPWARLGPSQVRSKAALEIDASRMIGER